MDKKRDRRVGGRALWQTLLAGAVGVTAVVTMVPAYLSLQAKARQVSGLQNLQQWGIALNLHLMDNANQLPETGSSAVVPEQRNAWYNSLPEYIGERALADRPVGQRPRPGDKSLWMDPAAKPLQAIPEESFYFNYGMNKFLQPDPTDRTARVTDFGRPGQVVFMTRVSGYTPWVIPDEVVFPSARSGPMEVRAATPVLFCDGHTELLDAGRLIGEPSGNSVIWFAPKD
ncbi:MAG: hypothetical protein ACOYMS_06890 [Terrimicrobiaceae bacterium]